MANIEFKNNLGDLPWGEGARSQTGTLTGEELQMALKERTRAARMNRRTLIGIGDSTKVTRGDLRKTAEKVIKF